MYPGISTYKNKGKWYAELLCASRFCFKSITKRRKTKEAAAAAVEKAFDRHSRLRHGVPASHWTSFWK